MWNELVYRNLSERILEYLIARPLRLVYADGMNRVWARVPMSHHIREAQHDALPVQVWSPQEFFNLLDAERPVELHCRSAAFHEYARKLIVVDLDTAEYSGLTTSFRWAKKFTAWLKGRSEVVSTRILFTGNRGFHVRCILNRRYEPEEYAGCVKELIDGFGEPFLGILDTGVTKREHFVRCPHSYNQKGQRFSFFVETFDDFSEDTATSLSRSFVEKYGR